jgi:uncharacterized protein with beta-barrel porin domain
MGTSRSAVGLLLATSSVAALIVAGSGPARAFTACTPGTTSGYTNPLGTSIACILFNNLNVTGNAVNAGTIHTTTPTQNGIAVLNGTFNGAVTNTGTITATANGIFISGTSTLTGGISNSGSISALNFNKMGIGVTGVTNFSGGIANGGTISIQNTGISVTNTTVFTGGITNTGTISGNICAVGIRAQGIQSFTGGIVNGGTITAGTGNGIGIEVIGLSTFTGGITNTGTISGRRGVLISATAGVSIFDSGTITSTAGTNGTAIQFGVGANTLTLAPGFAITGRVLGSGGDVFQLGGTGSGTFDLSKIGAAQQYRGFSTFNIVGATWTATSTFGASNAWTVQGGTLLVGGDLSPASGIAVTGGVLGGTGTVPGTTVNSGGTLMPGLPGTVGTLTVSGNLVLAAAATYMITINGANASKTSVSGTATTGGASVNVANGSSIIVGQKYTILTAAGGVSGTFNPTVMFGIYSGTISYDPDDAFLTFALAQPPLVTPLLPPGAPTNVLNVAGAIDGFIRSGATLPLGFQRLLTFTPQQLENALTQLSGEAATGAQGSSFELMKDFLTLLTEPHGSTGNGSGPALPFAPERVDGFPADVALAYASVLKAPPPTFVPHWSAWGAAFGGGSSTSGDPLGVGSHDVTAHTGAVAAGIDYHVSSDTIVGVALAGGGTSWGLSAGLGGGRSDVFLAGLYGSKQWGQSYLSGTLTYSSDWMSTSRTIAVAGTDTLSAAFNAQNFGGRLEGGQRVTTWAPFSITPYAALQVQSFWAPAYGESGSLGAPDASALTYASQTATVLRSELGSRFDRIFPQPQGCSIDLFGRIGWAHDWQSNPNLTATFIGLPTATFVVNGAAAPSNLALVSAGAESRWRNGWTVLAKFAGEFASRSGTYTGTAIIKYSW